MLILPIIYGIKVTIISISLYVPYGEMVQGMIIRAVVA